MSQLLHHIPARIITRELSPEQLKPLIQAELGDLEPFFWSAEISNNNLDFYFGRMAESTLRNFANDATAGVTFLDSHSSDRLGYGRSLQGVFEASGSLMRTVAYFYTVPGVRFGGELTYGSTDDFILSVRSRLAPDVSVGFYGGKHICDICGEDVYAFNMEEFCYRCPHIPGVEYAVGNQGNDVLMCTFTVEDARLSEVSNVYDGATPGAAILKATRMIETVDMSNPVLYQLETKYRIKAPEKRFVIAKPEPKTERIMDELEETKALLAELNPAGEGVAEQVRWLISENARLSVLADDGKQYRQALTDEAIAEGIATMGNNFPTEVYQKMFERSALVEIRTLRDRWKAQADTAIPQGRLTVQEDETQPAAAFDLLKLPTKTDYSVHK